MSLAHPSLASEPARAVEEHLRLVQRRDLRQRSAVGVLVAAAGLIAAGGLLAVADYFLELSWAIRAAAVTVILATAVGAGIHSWRRWLAPYNLSQAARAAEQRLASFGQRLRTTVDYQAGEPVPAPAQPGLVAALRRDTYELAQRTSWEQALDRRPLARTAMLAAALGLAALVTLVAEPEMRTAAGRALLLPWHYTTVTYSPAEVTVRSGESVTIVAEVTGRPIRAARVRFRPAAAPAEWQWLDLRPPGAESEADAPLHGELAATLAKLEQDLEFDLLAGPRSLPRGTIRVLQPLTLEAFEARIVPPEYSKKPVETSTSLDLKVWEGSTVDLELRLSRAAAESHLLPRVEPGGDAASAPAATPFTQDGKTLFASLSDLRQSGSYIVRARAADGIELDPLRLNIQVQRDQPPRIRFVQPSEELAVIPTAEVTLAIEAQDDLGLRQVGILYQVGAGPLQTLWEHDAQDTADPFSHASQLSLEELEVSFPGAVNYFAYAEDNYFGEPRRVVTPLRYIDIRPFKLAFQLLDTGGT